MRWPWQRRRDVGTLVIGGTPQALAWVHSSAPQGQPGALLGCGVIHVEGGAPEEAGRRLRALALPVRQVLAVLPLQDALLLQIEAPAVPPDELKAAARWRIKDFVDGKADEQVLDVMNVGDGRARAQRQLFVAAAPQARVQAFGHVASAAGLGLNVVDIAEMAQRNLHAARAAAQGLQGRATAALMSHGSQLLLSICVDGELFYARRLAAAAAAPATPAAPAASAALDLVDFVDYGEAEAGAADEDSGTGVLVELQRSLDVWERSWPDLPLAQLGLDAVAARSTRAVMLSDALGLPVHTFAFEGLFPGLPADEDTRAAVQPLLGLLLREAARGS